MRSVAQPLVISSSDDHLLMEIRGKKPRHERGFYRSWPEVSKAMLHTKCIRRYDTESTSF